MSVEIKANHYRNCAEELLRARQDLKAKRDAVRQAEERVNHLRECADRAHDELTREALGPDLAKQQIIHFG